MMNTLWPCVEVHGWLHFCRGALQIPVGETGGTANSVEETGSYTHMRIRRVGELYRKRWHAVKGDCLAPPAGL